MIGADMKMAKLNKMSPPSPEGLIVPQDSSQGGRLEFPLWHLMRNALNQPISDCPAPLLMSPPWSCTFGVGL